MAYFLLFLPFIFYKTNKTKLLISEKDDILIENLFDGIILLNLNLEIIKINNEALKLLDWEFDKVYKTNFLLHFDFPIKKIIIKKIEKIILEKNYEEKNYDQIIISKNSYKKTILLIIKIAKKEKKIVGIVLKIDDITRKIKTNKRKANFLNNISHELRTPLFNIQSFIKLLQSSSTTLKKEEINEFLNITNKEILRLTRLVNTTLNISKFNYKNMYIFSTIFLADVFNEFIQIYNIRLKEKKINIIKEIQNDLNPILAKKDLLFQVFDNLIGNAVKFSNFNGIIIFRAYQISNKNSLKVRIEIGDGGIGILKVVQKNIFRRFSILNNELNTIYGNGLGLSITKKILEKQGSTISFSSDYNEGIIFFIDFIISTKNN